VAYKNGCHPGAVWRSTDLQVHTPREVRINIEHFARPIPDDMWQELKAEGLIRGDTPVPDGACGL